MKKIILLQILFLFIATSICIAQADKPKIIVKYKIASHKKDCESGLGLCIFSEIQYRTVDTYISAVSNKIQIQLLRNNMNEYLENELLRAHRFPIEEGTILPMDLCLKIGLRGETLLKQGYYPIQVADDYFIIECEID
jgi:hypothetical protein